MPRLDDGKWLVKALLVTWVAIVASALLLVQVRYEARKLEAKLNSIKSQSTKLELQARRYQIEMVTMTDYAEVLTKAVKEHGMVYPDLGAGNVVHVRDEGGAGR